jgi:hypothetical protein
MVSSLVLPLRLYTTTLVDNIMIHDSKMNTSAYSIWRNLQILPHLLLLESCSDDDGDDEDVDDGLEFELLLPLLVFSFIVFTTIVVGLHNFKHPIMECSGCVSSMLAGVCPDCRWISLHC